MRSNQMSKLECSCQEADVDTRASMRWGERCWAGGYICRMATWVLGDEGGGRGFSRPTVSVVAKAIAG